MAQWRSTTLKSRYLVRMYTYNRKLTHAWDYPARSRLRKRARRYFTTVRQMKSSIAAATRSLSWQVRQLWPEVLARVEVCLARLQSSPAQMLQSLLTNLITRQARPSTLMVAGSNLGRPSELKFTKTHTRRLKEVWT